MTRAEEYEKWMHRYFMDHKGYLRGKCADATKKMAEAFPELRAAAGFVHCSWGRDQHWWCVTNDGTIVDPTSHQFEPGFRYEEVNLNDPNLANIVPSGKCPNCGGPTYRGEQICSKKCEVEYVEYLNKECRR